MPSLFYNKKWVAAFKRVKKGKEAWRAERPISMSTAENIDVVHDMIWED